MPIALTTDIVPFPYLPKSWPISSLVQVPNLVDPFIEFRDRYDIVWNKKDHTVTMVRKTKSASIEWVEVDIQMEPCLFCGHACKHPCLRTGCTCKSYIKKV